MNYIVFDFEFNQDFTSTIEPDRIFGKDALIEAPIISSENKKGLSRYPFEIIQIGAVKLDSCLSETGIFNRYVKPGIYQSINPRITELTGITTEQLSGEETFDKVYEEFLDFIGGPDCVLCTWGMSDLKSFHTNAGYHRLSTERIPSQYINLQPNTSVFLKQSPKKLMRLSACVELLGIPITQNFHNALHDAYYTAEIFKKINSPLLQPKTYHPSFRPPRERQEKTIINFDKLFQQFEKMFGRPMMQEEQRMIKLAYQMGRTRQFVEKELSCPAAEEKTQ